MRRSIFALALPLLLAAPPAPAQVNYQHVYNDITAPATSDAMLNIGQTLHLMTVIFATAVADVESLEYRIEASFDNSTYFPITEDLTTAYYHADLGMAYGMIRGNGPFPYVRVRVVATSGALPADVHYTGSREPIGNVRFATDRWLAAGSDAGRYRATWLLCIGTDCAIGTNLTARYLVTTSGILTSCWITAKTAPTGAAIEVDINLNGATTVFGVGNELALAAGTTGPTESTTFDAPSVDAGEYLTIDLDQIGSAIAGKDVSISCTIQH